MFACCNNFSGLALHPILISYGLERFIDSSTPQQERTIINGGEAEINPDYISWRRKDKLLLDWIISCLSESETIHSQIVGLGTSYEVWKALKGSYATQSRALIMQLKELLQCMKKGPKNYEGDKDADLQTEATVIQGTIEEAKINITIEGIIMEAKIKAINKIKGKTMRKGSKLTVKSVTKLVTVLKLAAKGIPNFQIHHVYNASALENDGDESWYPDSVKVENGTTGFDPLPVEGRSSHPTPHPSGYMACIGASRCNLCVSDRLLKIMVFADGQKAVSN
ncbi:hypothetical protein EJ110_NYTH44525 [Nymphaea thermarum]|nr:hypothetical protein EJ110_NYTH44525 [Nymphaea thermarum]